MTWEKDIVKLISVTPTKDLICQRIKHLDNFYEYSIRSSFLNIFEGKHELEPKTIYKTTDIKSKVFAVKSLNNTYVFFPLIHSYQEL